MRLRWRDLETAERCGEMEFILYGREVDALVEGVAKFKYLGRPLDKMYHDWPAVRRNFKWEWRFWGRLGKLLRREGAEPKAEAMLYRAVKQAVLLFGS